MYRIIYSLNVMVLLIIVTGCSSWRYCGYDSRFTDGKFKTEKKYCVDSISVSSTRGHWRYIDNAIYTQDIMARFMGECPEVFDTGPDAIHINLYVDPCGEIRSGRLLKVLSWCSFRAIPSFTTSDMPYDFKIEFPNHEQCADHSHVKIDTMFSSLPFGAIKLGCDVTAVACVRLNGAFVKKSGYNGCLEDVFFKTFPRNVAGRLEEFERDNQDALSRLSRPKLKERSNKVNKSPIYKIDKCERINGETFAYRFQLSIMQDVQFEAMSEIRDQLSNYIKSAYLEAYAGSDSQKVRVGYPEYKIENGKIVGTAVVLTIAVKNIEYDDRTHKGVMRIAFGAGQYEEARKWIRKNICNLARDKNVALSTDKLPEAGRFFIGDERVVDNNVLEIKFEIE